MKKLFSLFLFFMAIGCSSNNVYWCDDHPCKNEKEKKAYFKKTMIVEMKNLKKKKIKFSEIEKITHQALGNYKEKIKEEKLSAKKIKQDKKKQIKKEKKLAKKIEKEKKKVAKNKILINPKKNTKKIVKLSDNVINIPIQTSKFEDLIKKINKNNILRPYPNINDIPN